MQEVDLDNVTSRVWNRYEGFTSEEYATTYLQEALTEGPAGFVDALTDVGVARFLNHLAGATGIDRLKLCAVFAGHAVLDEASVGIIAQTLSVPTSESILAHA